jgi:hypothetical protein
MKKCGMIKEVEKNSISGMKTNGKAELNTGYYERRLARAFLIKADTR